MSGRFAAAQAAGRALQTVGFSGVHDFGPAGSAFVPRLEQDGTIALSWLFAPPEPLDLRLAGPPLALEPLAGFDAAYVEHGLSAPAARVEHVRDGRMIGHQGALVNVTDGSLYLETTVGRAARAHRMRSLMRPRWLRPPEDQDRPLLMLATYDSGNYFHFLTDVLCRLYAFSDNGRKSAEDVGRIVRELDVVVNEAEPGWQRQYLTLFGVEPRLASLGASTHWRIRDLVFPLFAGTPHPLGQGLTLFPREVLSWVGQVLREAVGASDQTSSRRLYITRATAVTRSIRNEAELVPVLERFGFERVAPELLSVEEQIKLFATAELVVAPHGAGLANLLLSPNCTVVELVSPAHVVPCFYLLAAALGRPYWYVSGRVAPDAAPGDFTVDFDIPPDALSETLALAIGS